MNDITSADVTVNRGEVARSRVATIFRIAELMRRYEAIEVAGKWRIRNRETAEVQPSDYAEESLARSGARLACAADILALFDAK